MTAGRVDFVDQGKLAMAESVFGDKARAPTSAELDKALGPTAALLKEVEQHLLDQCGEITREWKFYGSKAGWTLVLSCKGRRIFHLIPESGLFTVVFTLGKPAVLAARGSELPAGVLSAIADAREYAEGKSIRWEVISTNDVTTVKQLVAIKLSN